ncbi:MAG TPA: ABC transporter permease [Chloroflexota bacterium]|nr:ABC transporter permease [Chloroflexota bacterium]
MEATRARVWDRTGLDGRQALADSLPFAALLGMFAWCVILQPQALSIYGVSLLFSSSIPLVLATISQMFIITLGDIDLGTGYAVGLANVISARYLASSPLIAIGLFAATILGYMIAGALVELRRIPSIIVTLGTSFIWLGAALLILDIPGGTSPDWLAGIFNWAPSMIPVPFLYAAVIAAVASVILFRTTLGTVLRGAGSNPQAVARAGWSLLRIRMLAYGLAGLFGILAGLALTGITTSGDANASANYTLLAIASVIAGRWRLCRRQGGAHRGRGGRPRHIAGRFAAGPTQRLLGFSERGAGDHPYRGPGRPLAYAEV